MGVRACYPRTDEVGSKRDPSVVLRRFLATSDDTCATFRSKRATKFLQIRGFPQIDELNPHFVEF